MSRDKNDEAIILETGQEVEIADRKYTMRRLTTRDVFAFSKLVTKALKSTGNQEVANPDALGFVLMAGMAENDHEVAAFYGSLIGLSADEFLALPAEAFSDFFDALSRSYDLQAFFEAVTKAVRALGSLWQTPST
ncbi:MAG TPA: hypothetical protein GXX40_05700 [Firmicutes bacterium]|nr:hypothetical protein [Bacillota bacterium]